MKYKSIGHGHLEGQTNRLKTNINYLVNYIFVNICIFSLWMKFFFKLAYYYRHQYYFIFIGSEKLSIKDINKK